MLFQQKTKFSLHYPVGGPMYDDGDDDDDGNDDDDDVQE